MRALVLAAVVVGALGFRLAHAQEVVVVDVPARAFNYAAGGERIAYLQDGGCASQAESRIQNAPQPVGTAQCNLSRARSRKAVADAIDGGALDL